MKQEMYIKQIMKYLKCSKRKRQEIKKDLTMDILAAEENGELLEDIQKRMGNPADIAAEFNSNFSEEERKKYKKEVRTKQILSIAGVLVLFLAIGLYWIVPKSVPIEKSKNFKKEEVIEQAKHIIQLVEEENYELLSEASNQEVKKALEEKTLGKVKLDLGIDSGSRAQSFGNYYIAEMKQMGKCYGAIQMNVSYENTSITYTILFDKDMKIAGLYLK